MGMKSNHLKHALLLGAATLGAMATDVIVSPAYAQEATRAYNIPAQNLDDALREFGRQSGRDILFTPQAVAGKRGNPIAGDLTEPQALTTLLAGTGLRFERIASGGYAIQDPGAQPAARGGAEVTGRVRDVHTNGALRGAIVRIEETGQTVATNDAGEFRFPNVAPGEYTLHISYLGYDNVVTRVQFAPNSRFNQDFDMGDDDAIVVYGQRTARAQALNQERTSENSTTIISADHLGQFDGTTISDSLRRAPGFAFQPNATTGEGANVIVRGLAPDLNTVTLNGVRLPVANGVDRSPSLNNILTDSISRIVVNTTLLPNHDSSGTGGLIEVETLGPLDRPERYFNMGVERGGAEEDFLDDTMITATASRTFGEGGDFGVSASVQYRERENAQLGYGASNQLGFYYPLDANGQPTTSIFDIDPRATFPYEADNDDIYQRAFDTNFNASSLQDLAVTLSAQWQPNRSTSLRADLTYSSQERDTLSRTSKLNILDNITFQPIDDQAGETRATLQWQDAFLGFGIPGALMGFGQQYQMSLGETEETTVLSLRGSTTAGAWTFNYGAGGSIGESSTPQRFNIAFESNGPILNFVDVTPFLTAEAQANAFQGYLISPWRTGPVNGYRLPLFNEQGFAYFNDPTNFRLPFQAQIVSSASSNERYSTNASARYEFINSPLQYVEGGVFLERSEARATSADRVTTLLFEFGHSPDEIGLPFSADDLGAIGVDGGFRVVSFDDLRNFLNTYENYSPIVSAVDAPTDPRSTQTYTREDERAAYLQARLDWRQFEIIGGLRIEQVDVEAVSITNPSITDENGVFDIDFAIANSTLVSQQASETDLLPRILVNYRPNDTIVARAGYYTTVARPALSQLNSDQTVSLLLQPFFGPLGNQPMLSIYQGNPDLRPAVTHNFDLSLELYSQDVGTFQASIFHKRTENLIFNNESRGLTTLDGVVLPDDPRFQNLPADIFITGSRPSNSADSATLWGVELTAERRLSWLPGWWSGLGVLANFTHTESSRTEDLFWTGSASGTVDFDGVPYLSQPENSGTIALTYSGFGIESALSYTMQDRYMIAFNGRGRDSYQDELSTLDFRIQYRGGGALDGVRIYAEGSDLLRGPDEPDGETSLGADRITGETASYFGGRSFRFGVAASF